MRTTIRLDSDLMRQLKQLAAETHRTLTAVIQDAVREVISRRKRPKSRSRVKLPTFPGWGLRPGINLDDSADLLDKMEGR